MDLKTLQVLQSEIENILKMLSLDFIEPAVELGEDEILKVELRSSEGNDQNLGILIGSRGDTLAAIEYILALVVNKDREEWLRISLDVDGYREKRKQGLIDLAHRMADKVAQENESISLRPMPSFERRTIHMALSDRGDIATESTGDGRARRIVIKPR